MKSLKLSKNLVYLRRKKGVTQEVIADFLGVTKASVSKWETGLSLPDIAQLPKLASYYDISIDELIGYEAQLTKEEIKEYYIKFSDDFVKYSFDDVMKEIRDFIRQYYSCYPALLHMIILLVNHCRMADESTQSEILEEMIQLCEHIQDKCVDIKVCTEASVLQGIIELTRGNPDRTIEKLQDYQGVRSTKQDSEGILIQAYQMAGQQNEALELNQAMMFNHLLGLVEGSMLYLMSNLNNKEVGMLTIERIKIVMDVYELNKLHPNTYLRFQYAMAAFYSTQGMVKEEVEALKKYAEDAVDFVKNALYLHGDNYFDRLEHYYEKMEGDVTLPRSKETILASIVQDIDNPLFANISDTKEYKEIRRSTELWNR